MMVEGRRQLGAIAGAMRQPPAPHYATDPATGNLVAIDRSGNVRDIKRETGEPIRGPNAGAVDQKQQLIQVAEVVMSDLEKSLKNNSRSTVGLGVPIVRGVEAVGQLVAPGAIGSQATLAAQNKQQLVQLGAQVLGGSLGRLSNQDTQRIQEGMGMINSGTEEGLKKGIDHFRTVINTAKRGGAAPVNGLPSEAALDAEIARRAAAKAK
jgi:hypothetical protein